jgi:glucokinase
LSPSAIRGGYGSRAVRSERAIGVDLGGTKILAGIIERDGTIGRTTEIPTPDGSETEILEALDSAVRDVLDDGVTAIGYGVPCNLDRRTGRALRATNLPLDDVDFVAHARDRFALPTGVENDANAAALAEWRLGAGRGTDNLVMLTLGTGVGGGLVLDGRLYRGWAELGHVVVVAGGPPCQGNCHGRGHVEAVASGLAADRAARELWGDGADAYRLVDAAQDGDEAARAALARIGDLLGAAIGSFVNMFDPEVVIIGGGFGAAVGDLVLGPARESARREAIEPADERLRIVEGQLGENAGLVGAGLVGFEALDGER